MIGTDKPSDLALVKVNATGLQTAPLGNSDNAQVGDVVLAIGNPLGVGQTVTMGIVSAKGRSTGSGDGDGRNYQDFLQTDAPINHGNSGGALVNTKGEVDRHQRRDALAGRREHRHRLRDSVEHGAARHGRSAQGRPRPSRAARRRSAAGDVGSRGRASASSTSAAPSSARSRPTARRTAPGLKRGDVIQSFNGQPVSDINSLRNHVAEAQPGSNASVVIVRDGAEKTVSVKLDEADVGKRSARNGEPASADKAALGIGVERGPKGLVITAGES